MSQNALHVVPPSPYKPPKSALAAFFWRRKLWFESTFALSMLEPWEKMMLSPFTFLRLLLDKTLNFFFFFFFFFPSDLVDAHDSVGAHGSGEVFPGTCAYHATTDHVLPCRSGRRGGYILKKRIVMMIIIFGSERETRIMLLRTHAFFVDVGNTQYFLI
jgi:hypothetical protein